jgi:hypothetical protein
LKEQGSFGDKTERWLQMAANGQYPPGMIQAIESVVDAIMEEHNATFNEARARAVSRGIAGGVDVEPFLFKPNTHGAAKKPTQGAATTNGSRIRGVK